MWSRFDDPWLFFLSIDSTSLGTGVSDSLNIGSGAVAMRLMMGMLCNSVDVDDPDDDIDDEST
jgi:hypothetical protein